MFGTLKVTKCLNKGAQLSMSLVVKCNLGIARILIRAQTYEQHKQRN